MFDFYQKRKMRTVMGSPITRAILLLIVLAISWSAFTRFQIAEDMKERRQTAEKEVFELREQKALLDEKVRYLSDERGIEAEMRRQFDVALPDEQVVVIVEPEDEIEPLTRVVVEEEPAWYEFWR